VRSDFQLSLPLFMEPEVTHAHRPPNLAGHRSSEPVPTSLLPGVVLEDVQVVAQIVLPFTRVDNPFSECEEGSRMLSAESEAHRAPALSPRQVSMVASALGISSNELNRYLSVLPSEGA
jgi:hypothetical protein